MSMQQILPRCPVCGSMSGYELSGMVGKYAKCPQCGASVDFPKSGNQTQCVHCGKTIYAQDVFEKVKGLI